MLAKPNKGPSHTEGGAAHVSSLRDGHPEWSRSPGRGEAGPSPACTSRRHSDRRGQAVKDACRVGPPVRSVRHGPAQRQSVDGWGRGVPLRGDGVGVRGGMAPPPSSGGPSREHPRAAAGSTGRPRRTSCPHRRRSAPGSGRGPPSAPRPRTCLLQVEGREAGSGAWAEGPSWTAGVGGPGRTQFYNP